MVEIVEVVELLPCPFCGGDPIADNLGDPMDDSFIHCSKCEVQQIANYAPHRAAALWNTRANSTGLTSEYLRGVEDAAKVAEAWGGPPCTGESWVAIAKKGIATAIRALGQKP